MKLELKLDRSIDDDFVVPMEQYDVQPTYYVYGGLVMCPLTKNLLKEWGSRWFDAAPKHLTSYMTKNLIEDEVTEVVVLLKVLAASLNQGYHNSRMGVVDSIDGVKVKSLKHAIELIEEQGKDQEFVEFVSQSRTIIVLDRKKADADAEKILGIYRIAEDRSADLK